MFLSAGGGLFSSFFFSSSLATAGVFGLSVESVRTKYNKSKCVSMHKPLSASGDLVTSSIISVGGGVKLFALSAAREGDLSVIGHSALS